MKNNFIKFISLFIVGIYSININAQISYGGQPEFLKKSYKNQLETKVLPAVSQSWKESQAVLAEKNGTIELIAKNISTNYNLTNSGNWIVKKNGDRVWRLKIKANNAIGVNALFKDFYLAEGSRMFIYNEDFSQIIGSFNEKNNHESGYFATEIIFGDVLIIEYYEPKDVAGEGHFTLEKVGSFYKDLVHYQSKGFGDSDNCQVNINCNEGNSWQQEKNGVARILVQSSSGSGWCSGSLINNKSNKEYFLTAYHCGNSSSASHLNQWIFYFNYEFNACNNSGTEPTTSNSITGAQLVSRANDLTSTSISSDFMLLELNNAVPSTYSPYYNGWNVTNSAPSSGVSIHHPSGDVKKISSYNSSPSSVGVVWSGSGYTVVTGGTHWSVDWVSTTNGHGVTEGGSSGSPIFNSNGEIVGTLSGGGSSCLNTNQDDQYGKMSYHWQSNGTSNNRRLKPWLDPSNTGITSMPGATSPGTGGGSGNLNDAAITAIVRPNVENCSFNIEPVVTIINQGTANLLTLNIVYTLNSGAQNSFNWSGNLSTGESENVSLPVSSTTSSSNNITVTLNNPNGLIDGNSSDNSMSLNFEAGVSQEIPFYENFEANPTDNPLTVINNDDDETWSFSQYGGFETSSNGVFFDNWDYDAVGEYDWFITQAYDFTNVQDEILRFDLAYTYYQQTNGSEVSYDTLGIAASLDCGENFFWIWKEGGTDLATLQGGLGTEFTPQLNDWKVEEINLSQFNGESSVQFAFININGYGNNVYLDNILIGKNYVTINEVNALANQLNIFPNPTKGLINIALSEKQNINYIIRNTLGQEVYHAAFNGKNETIDVSQLNKGIYYLEINNGKEQEVVKFVKE